MQSVLFIAIIKIKKNYVKLLRLCWTVFRPYRFITNKKQVCHRYLTKAWPDIFMSGHLITFAQPMQIDT